MIFFLGYDTGINGGRHGQTIRGKKHVLVYDTFDELKADLVGIMEEFRLGRFQAEER